MHGRGGNIRGRTLIVRPTKQAHTWRPSEMQKYSNKPLESNTESFFFQEKKVTNILNEIIVF